MWGIDLSDQECSPSGIFKQYVCWRTFQFYSRSRICAIAGNIYKHKKTKKSAVVSGLVAALVMGIVSVFSNYFVVYPVYYKAGMAEEAILQMYQAIAPSMKSVLQCLICFNLPFTIVKGLIAVVICMLIYKPLSPVLKGRLSEY